MLGANRRVLIVDDQMGIRRLLEEVLKDEGYDVDLATNGLEALDCVQKVIPDLIMMDMKMPGMDGIAALKELKDMGLAERVIMMTAYGELEMVNEAKELGAYAYIIKPFDIIDVCDMAAEYLAKHN